MWVFFISLVVRFYSCVLWRVNWRGLCKYAYFLTYGPAVGSFRGKHLRRYLHCEDAVLRCVRSDFRLTSNLNLSCCCQQRGVSAVVNFVSFSPIVSSRESNPACIVQLLDEFICTWCEYSHDLGHMFLHQRWALEDRAGQDIACLCNQVLVWSLDFRAGWSFCTCCAHFFTAFWVWGNSNWFHSWDSQKLILARTIYKVPRTSCTQHYTLLTMPDEVIHGCW